MAIIQGQGSQWNAQDAYNAAHGLATSNVVGGTPMPIGSAATPPQQYAPASITYGGYQAPMTHYSYTPYPSPYSPQPAPTAGGNASTIPGATAFGYSPTAGGIPQVPNPVSTAGQAIGGNLGNLGGLGSLSTGVTGINAGIGQQPYNQNLPNYQGLLSQNSANALSNSRGIIPQDVINQLQQSAAERGVALGSPGSPNSNAAYLSAILKKSLDLQNTGFQQFGSLVGLTPTGPSFNPASMFVDPTAQQAANAAANLYNSAPIPQYAQNAAFGALNAGLNRGQGATGPQTSSADLVASILNKYSPTVGSGALGFGFGTAGGTQGAGGGSTAPYDLSGSFDPSDPLQGFYDLNLDPNAPSSDQINVDQLYPSSDFSGGDYYA